MRPTTTMSRPKPTTTVPATEISHNSTNISNGEMTRRRRPMITTTMPKPKGTLLSKVFIADANPPLISVPQILDVEANYIELLYRLIQFAFDTF